MKEGNGSIEEVLSAFLNVLDIPLPDSPADYTNVMLKALRRVRVKLPHPPILVVEVDNQYPSAALEQLMLPMKRVGYDDHLVAP